MTFRARFFILFSLTVVVGAGALTWGATRLARREFEQFDRERSDTLAAQFQRELDQRRSEVNFAMQGLADAEGTLRMALDLSRAQGDPSVYANDARGLAAAHQLDFLDLVADDGTLISSAQWPSRSGYKNDWVATEQDWNQRGAFLQRVELPDGVDLGVLAVRVVSGGAKTLYLIGGRRLDRGFFDVIALPAGTSALLYRNIEAQAAFAPDALAAANGSVDQPERFATLIESAEKRQGPQRQTLQWTGDPASAESFVAFALAGRQNEPLAVVLLGSTQREIVALVNSIRLEGLLVAALGILCGVFLSSWVSARVAGPLERLAAGMREVTTGNWGARVNVRARDQAGQLARAFNDMTKHLSDERLRLVQTERVAAWREMAQRMTREVKQSLFPMEVSVGTLTRARENSSERFSDVFFESMATLRSELDQLKVAVTRFGEFAKMPPPRLKPVDVNELVRAALKAFEPQFRAVGRPPITPELYLENGVSKIQADEDLLRKALENLLAHSIDAMPTGGLLTIRTGQANGFVRIEVSGSGAGAVQLESARPRPFGASRMRPAAAGLGMGLPTTQAIVSDLGGRFFAEAVAGVGATFRLEFPAAAAVAPPAIAHTERRRPETKRAMPEIPPVEVEAIAYPAEPSLKDE